MKGDIMIKLEKLDISSLINIGTLYQEWMAESYIDGGTYLNGINEKYTLCPEPIAVEENYRQSCIGEAVCLIHELIEDEGLGSELLESDAYETVMAYLWVGMKCTILNLDLPRFREDFGIQKLVDKYVTK